MNQLPKPAAKPKHQSWESFVDERIRTAYEEGEFARLAGYGQPIAGLDEPHDENWWLRRKLKAEDLTVSAPGADIRTDIQVTLAAVAKVHDKTQARRILIGLNQRIRESNRRMIGHANGTVMELDVEGIIEGA